MNDQKFDNEMRGSLWLDADRKNDKAPFATGTVTVSGLKLRIAMWPKLSAKVDGVDKTYWPVKLEYPRGTKFVLAKVSPAHILVTGAAASAAPEGPAASAPSDAVDDMPF